MQQQWKDDLLYYTNWRRTYGVVVEIITKLMPEVLRLSGGQKELRCLSQQFWMLEHTFFDTVSDLTPRSSFYVAWKIWVLCLFE